MGLGGISVWQLLIILLIKKKIPAGEAEKPDAKFEEQTEAKDTSKQA